MRPPIVVIKPGRSRSEEDVVSLLKRAIELELENRGFHLGAGKVLVFMELSKFYNDFKIGFWAGDAVAELVMNAQVKNLMAT